jgi:hypothetical protein
MGCRRTCSAPQKFHLWTLYRKAAKSGRDSVILYRMTVAHRVPSMSYFKPVYISELGKLRDEIGSKGTVGRRQQTACDVIRPSRQKRSHSYEEEEDFEVVFQDAP